MSDEVLHQRVTLIQRIETEKENEATIKVRNKVLLNEAKKLGKEAYEAEKTYIANEKLTLAEAKKGHNSMLPLPAEKCRQQAAKKAENVSKSLSGLSSLLIHR